MCLLISAVPVIGRWVFGTVIGIPDEVVPQALLTLGFISLMPLMAAIGEFYGGIMLVSRSAFWVTVAKFANVAAASVVAFGLIGRFPQMGAAIGAIGMSLGYAVEALVCWYMFNRIPQCRRFLLTEDPR